MKKKYNHFIPLAVLAALTILFMFCARIESDYVKNPNWQLDPSGPPEDYPSGFEGLAFCGKPETRNPDNPRGLPSSSCRGRMISVKDAPTA